MTADATRVRSHLKTLDYVNLFVDQLGWDRLRSAPIKVPIEGGTLSALPVAEKRGMTVFHCVASQGVSIPDRRTRRDVDRFLTSAAREHITIFSGSQGPAQVWQWARRDPERPVAYRETWFYPGTNGEALVHKVLAIEFQLAEEESLSLVRVEERVRHAFDTEKVTRRFYERFKDERKAFLKFIKGIRAEGDQSWYASLMINRLMFVYFIQRKGFLDRDPDYLRHKLETCKRTWGKDRFHTFYRHFLLRLFHEGLGKLERTKELDLLLGQVPYLNGGLFEVHALEKTNPHIEVADEAFERLFTFFDSYQWHLDNRPIQADNEINPDVLGFIFEKYINQKELGAYYTGRDITDYISSSTLIPFILNRVEKVYRSDSVHDGGPRGQTARRPEDFFFPEGKMGAERELPPMVAEGLVAPSARTSWNDTAGPEVGLPGETWREAIYRLGHFHRFQQESKAAGIASAEQCVRWNLDLRRVLLVSIEETDNPGYPLAVLEIIQGLTVLDPTCGSGAFLFSALNLIQQIYEACLDRIESFLAAETHEEGPLSEPTRQRFQSEIQRIAEHPSRRYYVLKSSIVSNLFGVDIMEEAAEICKLRLFLKLVAQVEDVDHLEALPDIDFNIRVGNSLVGYSSLSEVRQSLKNARKGQARLTSEDDEGALLRIETKARDADRAFARFRSVQTVKGALPKEVSKAKSELDCSLSPLEDELNRTLASEYGVAVKDPTSLARWVDLNRPFHWLVDYFGIMRKGGFDIAIGNPPYLEQRQIAYLPRGLETLETRAVHAMCVERATNLIQPTGCISMIVPLSLVATQRMKQVQSILERGRSVFLSNYSFRPAKLFDGVNRALTIFVAIPSERPRTFSTAYQKWASSHRECLLHSVRYTEVPRDRETYWIPKIGEDLERGLLRRMLGVSSKLAQFRGNGSTGVFYRNAGGLYWKVFTSSAPGFKLNGKSGHSSREEVFPLRNRDLTAPAIALLSSDLFWWWYTVSSDCFHLNPSDLDAFPVPEGVLADARLAKLGKEYLEEIVAKSSWLTRVQRQTGTTQTQSFKIQLSKGIINRIDDRLAALYGLSDEELDFIQNYEIKFRMSDSGEESD